jgi:hypothetical protein
LIPRPLQFSPCSHPEQIARTLRATKGGIAAAVRVLRCTSKTVRRYLDQYPELREIASDEVELALDLAEHSLFVDGASGDTEARRFLFLRRRRDRAQLIRREAVPAHGLPLNPAEQHNTVIVVDGTKRSIWSDSARCVSLRVAQPRARRSTQDPRDRQEKDTAVLELLPTDAAGSTSAR